MIKLPSTQGDWGYASPWPDLVLPMQDAVASTSAVDASGNGYNFGVNNVVTFGTVGSNGRTAAESTDGTGYLQAPNTTLGDVNGNAVSFYGRFWVPAVWDVNRSFFGKNDSGADRWYTPMRVDATNQLALVVQNAGLNTSAACKVTSDVLSRWVDIVAVINPLTDRWLIRLQSDDGYGVGGVVDWSQLSADEIVEPTPAMQVFGPGSIAPGIKCEYFAAWFNHGLSYYEQNQLLTQPFEVASVTGSIGWVPIEDAIWDSVQYSTGFTDDKIIWIDKADMPSSGPWIALQWVEIETPGIDWQRREETPGQPAGQEFTDRTQGARVVTLRITCYAGIDGSNIGNSSPLAILNDIIAAMRSSSRLIALNAAGAGVGSISNPLAIGSQLTASTFEPRATVEVTIHVASELAETSTYVESIITTVTVD